MGRKFRLLFCVAAVFLFAALLLVNTSGAAGAVTNITRVSVSSNGAQGNSASFGPALSADGRYIAFSSYSTNLVEADANAGEDVFLHDTDTGLTSIISVSSAGVQGNGYSWAPSISSDGRFIAFSSDAGNLVSGDTNGWADIFVHDMQTGDTTRVSVSSSGVQANDASYYPSISADGRYIAFNSYARNLVAGDTNNVRDVFVHDQMTHATTRVSVDTLGDQSNGDSYSSAISADGRYIAFYSYADNLMSDDPNGYHTDVFVHDNLTGSTSVVSVDSLGNLGNGDSGSPSISADGRYITFSSYADNLVSGDTNGYPDVFWHDRQTGTTERVSVASNGVQANAYSTVNFNTISADGRFVTFESLASNLVAGDVAGTLNNSSSQISRMVIHDANIPERFATLGSGTYSDIFVHDMQTGVTARLSLDAYSLPGNGWSEFSTISGNGLYVAFQSYADNLVDGDTNNSVDIFVVPATVYTLTVNKNGTGVGLVYTNLSTQSGINCGSLCANTFVSGTTISLRAVPAAGFRFAGWEGDLSGREDPFVFTINRDMSINAVFSDFLKIYLPLLTR